MLSKTLMKFALVLALWTIVRGTPVKRRMTQIDCGSVEGAYRPIAIYNSRYYLLKDDLPLVHDSLCCPLHEFDPETNEHYCIDKERIREECAAQGRGIAYEPCFHCFTCAKLLGEQCRGEMGIHGICAEGMKCFGWKDDVNEIGACKQRGVTPRKQVGEVCGGRFDSLGACEDGLNCTEVQKGSNRVCVMKGRKFFSVLVSILQ